MSIVVIGLVLFVALIFWLIVSNLMEEKDDIINAHLHSIEHLERRIKSFDEEDHKHKMWLVDVAHLTKLSEIKSLLMGYAQPKQPTKNIDPKSKK